MAIDIGQDRALARDAALARISRTRRFVLAGAAALTAGLAALASAVLPGKSFGAAGAQASQAAGRPAGAGSSTTPPLPAPANAAELGVSASGSSAQPAPAPQPTPQPQPASAPSGSGGQVVSGGS